MSDLVNAVTVVVVEPDVTFGIVMSFHTTLEEVGAYTNNGAWSPYDIVAVLWHYEMWILFNVDECDVYIHSWNVLCKDK